MAPYADHFFEGESIKHAIDLLKNCVSNDLGLALLMGEPGTGKSLVLALLERAYNQQFPVGSLVCSRLGNRQELLQSISFELGLPYKGFSEGELRLGLLDYLRNSETCPDGILLLIDEAHNLSSELLDELRLLANFARRGQPQVRAVLAGGLRLEDNVADPRLQSFNQRIGGRCWLTNLNRSETAAYVLDHLGRAGRDGNDIFDLSALKSIFELTDGCPRYINQLCNETLATAFQRSKEQIDAALVTETWAKLQNLPCDHFSKSRLVFDQRETDDLYDDSIGILGDCIASDEHEREAASMIEFGTLDEEDIQESGAEESEFLLSDAICPEAVKAEVITPDFDESPADECSFIRDNIPAESELEPEFDSAGSVPIEFVESFVSTPKHKSASEFDGVDPNQRDDQFADLSISAGEELSTPGLSQASSTEQGDTLDDEFSSRDDFVTQFADAESLADSECLASLDNQESNDSSSDESSRFFNPFEEGFAEEERVVNYYVPLVAAQNRASLDVTSSDLQSLDNHSVNCKPSTDIEERVTHGAVSDAQQAELNDARDDRDQVNKTAKQEAADLIQILCEALGESPDSFSHDEDVPHETVRNSNASSPPAASFDFTEPSRSTDQEDNEDNTWNANKSSIWFNQHQNLNITDDADELKQLEAVRDEIESQNRFSAQTFSNFLPSEQESDFSESCESVSTHQHGAEFNGDLSRENHSGLDSREGQPSGSKSDGHTLGGWSFRPYPPEDDYFLQDNPQTGNASANVPCQENFKSEKDQDSTNSLPSKDKSSQPVPSHATTIDDREIIVCELDSTSDYGFPASTPLRPAVTSLTPVSTGNAARMDYQELFEQLRNLPRE